MRETIPIADHRADAPTLADVMRELAALRAALAALVAERGSVAAYVSSREAAERLGISRATFHRQVAAGRLPAPIRLGKSSRWSWAEIEKSIAGKRRK